MQHYCSPIGDQHQDSPSGRRDRGQNCESDGGRSNEEQYERAHHAMTFIDMAESGNDAEQYRHRVARLRLCRLGGLKCPVAVGARLRVCGQGGPTKRTLHGVEADRCRLWRSVSVFHTRIESLLIVTRAAEFVKHSLSFSALS